ncbi:MAG: hypothetical protein SWK76_06410 [Actinomycetota bacterium]|nr:hypothetical protein [Actinomycetota bacterium]
MCIINWSVAYLENQRGMVMGSAHIVLAIIGFGVAFGRITSARIAEGYRQLPVLMTAAFASMVLTFFAPLPANGVADSTLIILASVFSSGIYPILLGDASMFPPSLSPAVLSAMMAALVSGTVLLPFLVVLLREHVGRVQGMCSISVVFLLLIISLCYR